MTDLLPSYLMERITRARSPRNGRSTRSGPASRSNLDVVEAAGVPQRHEIAAERIFAVRRRVW